ncbi:MAG: hypothetical protein HYX46_12030 [Betaproteobacteria bacterium]|nr:hypothetical protein [Betaproteobacteria bacterium]
MMWNGNAVTARTLLLAASMVLIAGCDIGAAPPRAENDAPQIQLPGARYQVDAARNRVWFLTPEGVFLFDVSRPERTAVPLPGWLWAGAPYACLPDLALGPRGEAVVTSNVLPLAVSVHPLVLDADTGKDVGFTGLVFSPQHGAFFAASDVHGSLWRIDPPLTRAQKIPLSAPIPQACGLALRPRSSQRTLSRMADLCVRTPHGGWSVLFAPDLRSASVSAAPCADRP